MRLEIGELLALLAPYCAELFAGALQGLCYGVVSRFGKAVPGRGTSTHQYHRVFATLVVVLAFWGYTVYSRYLGIVDSLETGPNYYIQFGLDRDFSRKELRNVYKQLSIMHHPDKIGTGGQQRWVEIKRMYDLLSNDLYRFGYDRLGDWVALVVGVDGGHGGASTTREIVLAGLRSTASNYAMLAAGLILWPIVNIWTGSRSWRWWLAAGAVVLEVALLTKSREQELWIPFLDHLLPFQKIALVRTVVLTTMYNLDRVTNLVTALVRWGQPPMKVDLEDAVTELETLVQNTEVEVVRGIGRAVGPVAQNTSGLSQLKRALNEYLIETKALKIHEEARNIFQNLMQREQDRLNAEDELKDIVSASVDEESKLEANGKDEILEVQKEPVAVESSSEQPEPSAVPEVKKVLPPVTVAPIVSRPKSVSIEPQVSPATPVRYSTEGLGTPVRRASTRNSPQPESESSLTASPASSSSGSGKPRLRTRLQKIRSSISK